MKQYFRIAFFNVFITAAFLLLLDIAISNIKNRRSLINPSITRFDVPRLVCSQSNKYDASSIYQSKTPTIINYKRDSQCYRSYDSGNELRPLVLTIGGSTTDQRFVDEADTYQNQLDKIFSGKYDFVNGGVDGQSTIGHLHSIKHWHSKALDPTRVKHIIFYIGVNDQGFNDFSEKSLTRTYTPSRRIRDYLANNSYLYTQVKNIYFTRTIPKSSELMAVHGKPFTPKQNAISQKILTISPEESKQYQEHLIELAKITHQHFPSSNIHVVQQQVPGCIFINRKTYVDRHQDEFTGVCESLLKVYTAMDLAFEKIDNSINLKVYPMYLKKEIDDDGFYDFIHTNKNGSKQIADYLSRNIDF